MKKGILNPLRRGSVVRVCGGGLLLLCGLAFAWMRWIGFPPREGPFPVGAAQLAARDGLNLQLWYPMGSGETRPLVLFFPSWSGTMEENTVLCRRLASEGFVVAGVAAQAPDSGPDFSSDAAFAVFLETANRELEKRVSDAERVLDWMLEEKPFPVPVREDRIGVAGYSFGGSVAAELCVRRPEVVAGVDLDGTLFGRAAADGTAKPFLFVTDSSPRPTSEMLDSADETVWRQSRFVAQSYADMDRWLSRHGGWMMEVQGAGHDHFSDRGLGHAWWRRGYANRVLVRLGDVMTAFFKGTLVDGSTEARLLGFDIEMHRAP